MEPASRPCCRWPSNSTGRRAARSISCAGAPSRTDLAFLDELSALGGDVELTVGEEPFGSRLSELVGSLDAATAVYVSGPHALVRAAENAWPAGRSRDSLLVAGSRSGEGVDPRRSLLSSNEFFVELATQRKTLRIPSHRSILSVVSDVFPEVRYSCTHGTCGQCETGVLAGEPIHRDAWLTAEEKRANTSMMICVGRSRSPRLVLDL